MSQLRHAMSIFLIYCCIQPRNRYSSSRRMAWALFGTRHTTDKATGFCRGFRILCCVHFNHCTDCTHAFFLNHQTRVRSESLPGKEETIIVRYSYSLVAVTPPTLHEFAKSVLEVHTPSTPASTNEGAVPAKGRGEKTIRNTQCDCTVRRPSESYSPRSQF